MSDSSKIEWTGATWNPWQGCRKKSPACKFCYMFADKKRYRQDPLDVHRSAKATFDSPLKWQREVERGDRTGNDRLVFTCSWSDWFIREADAWRDDAWAIIKACPDLIFQVLTKRPERMGEHLPWSEKEAAWSNVWLGVSVENQEYADLRIPHLLETKAAVRFLSVEPLLGPINFGRIPLDPNHSCTDGGPGTFDALDGRFDPVGEKSFFVSPRINWVIVGGESGSEARPMDPRWAASIRDQCVAAEVPFFFKQWGEWGEGQSGMPRVEAHGFGESGPWAGDSSVVYRVGKKSAGRTLDGRTWDELPRSLEATPC